MGVERLATLSNFLCSTPTVNKSTPAPKEEGPIRTRPQRTLGDIVEGLTAGRSAWIPPLVFMIGVCSISAMLVRGVNMIIKHML